MHTLTRKPKQLTLTLALAVLAIGALVAVALIAGGSPAQATTSSLAPDGGDGHDRPQQTYPTPTPTPRHATPEPCPSEAAEVVSTGHIALFDVWWNDDEEELTQSPCPPTVTHVPAEYDDRGDLITPASDTRAESNIDIEQTIIHIHDGAKIDLNAADTPYPEDKFRALWHADGLETRDTNGDGTPDEVADRMVWFVPACPPDGAPEADGLCLSFSAALLNPADWTAPPGLADVKVDFFLDHVHQIDIDRQDPRYVLTYDIPKDGATSELDPRWTTVDLGASKTPVAPGEYERPAWFFTSPGTYEFQMHIVGYPRLERTDGEEEISKEYSVSSDVREYILHVGRMADLSVGVEVDSANPNPGEEVTITLTASNAGPDKGENTKVDVILPEGLTWVEPEPVDDDENTDTETYDAATRTVTWSFGDLAKNGDETHTITARVVEGTRGQEQTVTANIYATEEMQSTDVVELDPRLDDNTDDASVTPLAIPNDDPGFEAWRSVGEHAIAGANVGGPIWVLDEDNVADLDYTLVDKETGVASPHFTHTVAELPTRFPERFRDRERGVQIQLTENADLTGGEWHELTLQVSDRLDSNGNDDSSTDNTITVAIEIVPDPWEDGTLTVTPDHANPATDETDVIFTAVLKNIPTDHGDITYRWETRRRLSNEDFPNTWDHHSGNTGNTLRVEPMFSRELQVRVSATVNDDYGTARTYGPAQSHTTWP